MAHWTSQFRRGYLELCILNHLARKADHGYQIVLRLRKLGGLEIRESSVYPVLARLRSDGHVVVHKEPSPSGPPRSVFSLSDTGQERLRILNAYWDTLTDSIHALRSEEA